MLGYVHLTAGRPVLERRAAAGMTYWALEGDLDGGLFPGRRLRRWIGRLERCGVSHAALPPGREGNFAPLRPVLPDGLRLALLPQLLDALAPAGDTALLLADCADSRALLAAQVLARRFRHLRLETGAGQEALERQLLRQLGLTTGGGSAAVTVTFGPPPREGLPLYLTPVYQILKCYLIYHATNGIIQLFPQDKCHTAFLPWAVLCSFIQTVHRT